MAEIQFELRLPKGPKGGVTMVVGGADSNHDGKIRETDEVTAFERHELSWTRKQRVPDPVKGTLFVVHFLVGEGVPWELVIKNEWGDVLYSEKDITMFPWGDAVGTLP